MRGAGASPTSPDVSLDTPPPVPDKGVRLVSSPPPHCPHRPIVSRISKTTSPAHCVRTCGSTTTSRTGRPPGRLATRYETTSTGCGYASTPINGTGARRTHPGGCPPPDRLVLQRARITARYAPSPPRRTCRAYAHSDPAVVGAVRGVSGDHRPRPPRGGVHARSVAREHGTSGCPARR